MVSHLQPVIHMCRNASYRQQLQHKKGSACVSSLAALQHCSPHAVESPCSTGKEVHSCVSEVLAKPTAHICCTYGTFSPGLELQVI